MNQWGYCTAVVCAALAVSGCGSSTDSTPVDEPDPGPDTTFCESKDDSPEWAMPLEAMGEAKTYKVSVVNSTPALPVAFDENTWTVKVEDASGNAVDDASFITKCGMVGHSHGCDAIVRAKPLGDGFYELSPFMFRMVGAWTILLTVTHGDVKDVAILRLCL